MEKRRESIGIRGPNKCNRKGRKCEYTIGIRSRIDEEKARRELVITLDIEVGKAAKDLAVKRTL